MRLNDPELVRREYVSEKGLAGRAAAYQWAEGPDPREIALEAIAEACPARVLEVGCGRGELAERLVGDFGVEVVAVDQSEQMVELTRARGIDARVGDVQKLPFSDGEFDCAVAAWMLYHVPDLDRGLAELARVLRPGGRLVAVTNGREHLRELGELLGVVREESPFSAENGGEQLRRHFRRVEARDASGWIVFPDRRTAQDYVGATVVLLGGCRHLPEFEGSLRVRRAPCVFVAEK